MTLALLVKRFEWSQTRCIVSGAPVLHTGDVVRWLPVDTVTTASAAHSVCAVLLLAHQGMSLIWCLLKDPAANTACQLQPLLIVLNCQHSQSSQRLTQVCYHTDTSAVRATNHHRRPAWDHRPVSTWGNRRIAKPSHQNRSANETWQPKSITWALYGLGPLSWVHTTVVLQSGSKRGSPRSRSKGVPSTHH